MKLNAKASGLVYGLVGAFGLFFATWWMMVLNGASGEPTLIGYLYRDCNLSRMGYTVGLIWALVDGAIGGVVFAWLSDKIVSSMQKSTTCPCVQTERSLVVNPLP